PQQQYNGDIPFTAVQPDARVREPPVQQDGETDDGDETRDTANHHGKELMTDRVECPVDRPMRREKADEMAGDHDDDAIVEKVRSKAELPLAQQLGGITLPGIGLAIETDQTANQQHREAEIGIDAEEKCIDVVGGQHVAISAFNEPAVFCPMSAMCAPPQD